MSVSVEHAQLLINSPTTVSSAVAGVTKADLQPSGSAIALTSLMALTPAQFDVDGQVVALQWQQAGWVISVDAGLITIAPQPLDGRRGIPVLTAAPTILGSDIQFQLSSGAWQVAVDRGLPTILGQDVVLEKNQFFVRGEPILTPSTIVLSENAVVVSAAPTIAGSDITLTWGQASVGVEFTALSIQGQDIGLNKSWSLAVDTTALDIDGQDVAFDWVVPATVVVEPARFSAVGSNFVLGLDIDVATTAISPAGQVLTRGDGTIVETAFLTLAPQNIDFIYDYPFGYAFDAAEPYFIGKDIVLFVGTGAPTKFRSNIESDKIQIAFSKPQTFNKSVSERIRG